MLRHVICWMLIAITPGAVVAADTSSDAAMLYGRGKVLLNGRPLPRSSAVFPGDVVQTQAESVATLDAQGSGVVVLPDSLVKFEGNAVSLEQGAVSVATSRFMVARAREVTVTPTSNIWTEFEVADVTGTVQVYGNKGNVNVNCRNGSVNLSEGEEVTADKSGNCNKNKRKVGTPLPAENGLLTNPYVLSGIVVTVGVLTCLLLCPVDKPYISQFKP